MVEEMSKKPLVPYELDLTRKYAIKYDIKRKYKTPMGTKQPFEEEFYNKERKSELSNNRNQKLLSAEERQYKNRLRLNQIREAQNVSFGV